MIFALAIFASGGSAENLSPESINATMLFGLVMFVTVLVVVGTLGLLLINYREKRKKERRQHKIENYYGTEYQQWRMQVDETGQIEPVPCSLMLKGGEECLYVAHGVTLHETRAVRHSTHTFGSVPLGKSRLRIGGGETTSRTTDEWTPIAKGDLYVTNKRIYFDGDNQDRIIPLDAIVMIKADYNAIDVSAETRQKSMIFTKCNGQMVRDIVQLVNQQ